MPVLSRRCSTMISIHALLAESDHLLFAMDKGLTISIHALLAESDRPPSRKTDRLPPFLSTLSLRRATVVMEATKVENQYFYPRSPCGERHHIPTAHGRAAAISIHALLAESDAILGIPNQVGTWISIHALLAESDLLPRYYTDTTSISIHALLAESDPRAWPVWSPRPYFYPRSPCGERPTPLAAECDASTISIHALLAESDGQAMLLASIRTGFLSTLSLRRATAPQQENGQAATISIHALLAESD